MRRFVGRKVIKIPRYQLFFFLFLSGIFVLFVSHLFLTAFLKQMDSERVLDVVVGNAYGNIINSSFYSNHNNYFYQNAFGFPFSFSQTVMEEKPNLKEPIDNTSPIVYLYNTFQTDKYRNPYYNSYRINPVVTQVNLILQEDLKNLGVLAFVENKSVAKVLKENQIAYSLSYRGSRILLEEAKRENPSLQYFFDFGISDDKRDATTFSSDDGVYARILFIVGTDNANYAENQKLAISLNDKLDTLYKGISRGISLRGGAGYHGIYNQDFSSNTLLIYVGGHENTIDEVNRSLKILAKAISEIIGEEIYESN